jgi:MoaA/NifB/PqqE/SkfB family radical SAM enzyme
MPTQQLRPRTALKVLGEVVKFHFSPRIKHVILHVTNICNMRCQHCFVDFETKPRDLTLGEFRALATDLNDLIWLDIGGGEPSLRKDLPEVIALFRAQEVSIPTNGWFPEKVAAMASTVGAQRPGRVIITVSLDGFESTHDEMRQAGSFKRALETIRRLREIATIRVKVNTVVCERNVDETIDFMKYVRDNLGVDYQGLLLLRGDPINPHYRLPSVEKLVTLGEGMRPIQESYQFGRKGLFSSVLLNYQAVKWQLQMKTLADKTQVIPCLGGQVHLVIYANGDVAPCELLPQVGNIRRQPIREILGSRAMADAVAGIKHKDCHCTHDCNMQENILFNPRLVPALLANRR